MERIKMSFGLRFIACFLAIHLLFITLLPTISWALTSGPNAPEYNSFEPVDVTDMVNLATGDFTYTLPILDVPGPEGGYPVALSYHAGIMMDQEASWTGLGWSLNAGAINRSVNLFADDAFASTNTIFDEWKGGSSSEFRLGIGYNGVHFGLTYANDTYRGCGTGFNLGIGIPIGTGVSAQVGFGVGPYGDTYGSIGISGTTGAAVKSGVSAGMAYSFDENAFQTSNGVGFSLYGVESLGFSLSSPEGSSGAASISVGGITAQSFNANYKNVQVVSSGSSFGLTVPTPVGMFSFSYGENYTRYWSSNADTEYHFGSLYPKHENCTLCGNACQPSPTNGMCGKFSFDSYATPNPYSNDPLKTDPDLEMGASMPAFDEYAVSAQGLGGSIKPYYYNEIQSLYRRNNDKTWFVNDGAWPSAGIKRASFRFLDDFSNYHVWGSALNWDTYDPNAAQTISPAMGKLGYSNSPNPQYYLPGSKHIEWFTNAEINDGTARAKGLVVDNINRPINFTPEDGTTVIYEVMRKQIGAFMITNSNGVTYHYTQPVYAYSEFSYSEKGESNRSTRNDHPYAYTWLLTAITGPDYVDRGNAGPTDEDWGYWVAFDYGRWSDIYAWRFPNSGMEKDIDSDVSLYNGGKKQLYYLDAIRTRSHTALFIKGLRKDGKGACNIKNGGFGNVFNSTTNQNDVSISTLCLDRILLFTNTGLANGLKSFGNLTSYQALRARNQILSTKPVEKVGTTPIHNWYQLIDVYDLQTSSHNLNKSATKEIVFSYDYSLCNGVPNSFDMNYTSLTNANPAGKLTLNKLEFFGMDGERAIPSTTFQYANNPTYNAKNSDIWGYYRPASTTYYKDVATKFPTSLSSKQVNAWSLTSINTGIGTTIAVEYESDSYTKSPFTPYRTYSIAELVPATDPTNMYKKIGVLSFYTDDVTYYPDLNNESLVLTVAKGTNTGTYTLEHYEFDKSYFTIEAREGSPFFLRDSKPGGPVALLTTPKTPSNTFQSRNGYEYELVAGNFVSPRASETFGGGLRVKSISTSADNFVKKTTYTYTNGMTPWEPIRLDVYLLDFVKVLFNKGDLANLKTKMYKKLLGTVIANKHVLPGPGVIYNKVELKDEVIDLTKGTTPVSVPGSSIYEFVTPTDPNDIFVREVKSKTSPTNSSQAIQYTILKDYSTKIGMLKKVTVNGANGSPLSIQTNNYLHEDKSLAYAQQLQTKVNNQGRVDELYKEDRRKANNLANPYQMMVTQIERYPTIQTNVVSEDKKRGIVTASGTVAFDPYSGKAISSWSTDGYGNKFVTVVEPAYTRYPMMGQKVDDNLAPNPLNKNMLSQVAASYTFKVKASKEYTLAKVEEVDKLGLLSATIQTWSTNTPVYRPDTKALFVQNQTTGRDALSFDQAIWRRGSAYVWKGVKEGIQKDGTQKVSNLTADVFSWTNNSPSSTTSRWQKQGAYVTYDVYSHELEMVDINNNSSAVLYDPTQRFVTAVATNAVQSEIAYSGAEYYASNGGLTDGNVSMGNGTPGLLTNYENHSGNYSLTVANGKEGFNCTMPSTKRAATKYVASVWAYLPGNSEYSLSDAELYYKLGTSGTETKVIPVSTRKARHWYLLELEIDATTGSGKDLIVGCRNKNASRAIYFDDFRVQPLEASMVAYVYDPSMDKLTHILNNDNLYIRYQYDKTGRLIASFQELFYYAEKTLGTNKLNYAKKN